MRTISCAQPRDVIALAWYQIGYRPRESLVLVGVHGPRQRSGLVLRVDLPPASTRRQALTRLGQLLSRCGSTGVIALVVSDTGGGPHPGPDGRPILPHAALARALCRELRRQRLPVLDVFAVGPVSFRSYLCPDLHCCPAGGTSLEEVRSSEVTATMVLSGESLADSEQALIADVDPEPAGARSDPAGTAAGSVWGRAGRRQPALRTWRRLLASAQPAPDDPVGLLDALDELPFRDAVLLTLAPDSGDLPERMVRVPPGRELPEGTDDAFGSRPDPVVVERARQLLAALARWAPPGRRAEPLAMLAWLAWWTGAGARARLLTERALADRPGHRMAALVASLLAAGVPPPWVRLPAS